MFRGTKAERLRTRGRGAAGALPAYHTARRGAAMTGWPNSPVVYEINTAVWLDELSRDAGRPVTLAEVAGAVGCRLPGRHRRGVADGRVGTQPGRTGGREGQRRADVLVS